MFDLTKTLLIAGAALTLSQGAKASLADFTNLSLDGTTAGWDIYYGANYLPTFTFATGTVGNPITNAGSNLNLVANPTGTATGPAGSTMGETPGNRELFYTFFASPVNFSITSVVAGGDLLTTYTFQSLVDSGSAGGLSNILMNGLAATSSGTNGSGVKFWTWSSLNLTSGSTVALTFDTLTPHSAIDAFQIQADSVLTAVPEPSVTALTVSAALVGVILLRRGRKLAKA